jgi:hypothetical protein
MEEAKELIVLACQTNGAGEYIASELVREQNLTNLAAFSDRLEKAQRWMNKRKREVDHG